MLTLAPKASGTVAGLAAYFLGLSSLEAVLKDNDPVARVRNLKEWVETGSSFSRGNDDKLNRCGTPPTHGNVHMPTHLRGQATATKYHAARRAPSKEIRWLLSPNASLMISFADLVSQGESPS